MALNTTEILDLETMTYRAGPEMREARAENVVVPLDGVPPFNHRALVVGAAGPALASTEILNIETMKWGDGPDMTTARGGMAVLSGGGQWVFVAGGIGRGITDILNSTEMLNVTTLKFEKGPAMLTPRWGACAARLDPNRILVVGGWDSVDTALATTEILDARTMVFTPGPPMTESRFGCTASQIPYPFQRSEVRVLIAGGCKGSVFECEAHATTEVLTSLPASA